MKRDPERHPLFRLALAFLVLVSLTVMPLIDERANRDWTAQQERALAHAQR